MAAPNTPLDTRTATDDDDDDVESVVSAGCRRPAEWATAVLGEKGVGGTESRGEDKSGEGSGRLPQVAVAAVPKEATPTVLRPLLLQMGAKRLRSSVMASSGQRGASCRASTARGASEGGDEGEGDGKDDAGDEEDDDNDNDDGKGGGGKGARELPFGAARARAASRRRW